MTTAPDAASTRSPRKTRADLPTQMRRENAQLREQLAKLAALVDHYYGAYSEMQVLLARRERELAEVRRKLECAPAPLRR
jgi:hypothetical protein